MESYNGNDDIKGYFFTVGLLTMTFVYAQSAAVHKWYLKTLVIEINIIYFTLRANNPHYKTFT